MSQTNLRIILDSLPVGVATEANFRVEEGPMPQLGEGEVLLRTHYLSLDPYMRMYMNERPDGKGRILRGKTMGGRTVSEVVQSNDARLKEGDHVLGWGGWQQYSVEKPSDLQPIDSRRAPLSAWLGPCGRPGITAWLGMVHVANVQAGETAVVSSAAGAVGSIAGQIARLRGARAVGIAGGPEKCRNVVTQYGFDACVDYKADRFPDQLLAATPGGVDVCFENVGAAVLDATLACLKENARIALSGLAGHYDMEGQYAFRNFPVLLARHIRLQAFAIDQLTDLHGRAVADLTAWLEQGKLQYRETITQGLEHAPRAFLNMLHGIGDGKHMVKVS